MYRLGEINKGVSPINNEFTASSRILEHHPRYGQTEKKVVVVTAWQDTLRRRQHLVQFVTC